MEIKFNKDFLTKINIPKIKKRRISEILKYENSKDSFDGMGLKSHRITVSEHLDKIFSPKKKERNIIFNKPFPVLNVISKRTLLNNSPLFVPKLINCDKLILLKQDQKLINSLNKKENNNNNSKKRKKKFCEVIEPYKNKSYSHLILNNVKTVPNIYNTIYKLKTYSRNHDTNLYNREYFIKKKNEFYDKYGLTNKYSFLQENQFFNKIRDDVSRLKFNNTLRVNFSLKSI
jgi:hypothetical protein